MRDISRRIFGKSERLTRIRGAETAECRGIISPLTGVSDLVPETVGYIPSEKYLYMGCGAELKEGDSLFGESGSYRVVSAGEINAFGLRICCRGELERI